MKKGQKIFLETFFLEVKKEHWRIDLNGRSKDEQLSLDKDKDTKAEGSV